jgi:hypothetical protein
MLLSLTDLLNSSEGLRFLASKGMVVDRREFEAQLRIPVTSRLCELLDVQDTKPVYSAQEVYIDYSRAVLSKLLVLHELEQEPDVFPFFLWVDTDRCGSDQFSVRIGWPLHGQKRAIRISPKALDAMESRFVALDPSVLKKAIDRLRAYLIQTPVEDRRKAQAKYDELRALFLQPNACTLSEFNLRVTYFLLKNQLGIHPRPVMLSNLILKGVLTDEVNVFMNHLDDIVKVFNESVQSLVQEGIDPHIKPLNAQYLPLHFSCPADNRRLRLEHVITGKGHFATATCKCGVNYSFYLGERTLSMDELAATKRWSPDVCLLIFLNDVVSGWVAGRSSALYSMVFHDVLRKVLHKTPVPILVPQSLSRRESTPNLFDSLIYNYVLGL